MALSREEIIEKTGCEVVCGQLLVGIGPTRKMIGLTVDGEFKLTADGEEYLAALDAQPEVKSTRGRKKKEVVEEVQEEPAAE